MLSERSNMLVRDYVLVVVFAVSSLAVYASPPVDMPEFHTTDPNLWINSEPLSKESLAGKVLLIDVWTFDCWNCYRSFPWLNELQAGLVGEDFEIIGIHSPEFEHEKISENVVNKVSQFKLKHPVVIDNEFTYWHALNNQYWPAFYVVDRAGKIRHHFVGETHVGDRQAVTAEQVIRELLEQ